MATIYVDALAGGDRDGTLGNPYSTITAAITAAASGDTVLIGAGTYVENIIIDKSLTLEGLEGSVIEGTFSDINGFDVNSTTVGEWLKTHASYTGGMTGLTVAADDVTLRNLTLNDFHVAIELKSNDGLTIEDSTITNMVMGIRKEAGVDIDLARRQAAAHVW